MSPNEISTDQTPASSERPTSTSIEWYSEGQSRIVEVDGIKIAVRFIARKGRRSRIAITAPAGAVFCAAEQE
jgi:hypothetical protein